MSLLRNNHLQAKDNTPIRSDSEASDEAADNSTARKTGAKALFYSRIGEDHGRKERTI